MRCKNCDYPLWNLKARACPECGEAFLPTEQEFVINSVAFCCPDCDQDYYGTGTKGHIQPVEFNCVRCGRHLHMDQMVLRPTKGVTEERTQVDRMPWLERGQRGNVKAFFATVGYGLGTPQRIMNAVPESAPLGAAWMFLITVTLLVGIGGWGLTMIGCGSLTLLGPRGAGNGFMQMALTGLIGSLVVALIIVVNVAIWGLTAHGILKISGGSTFSIGRTYQALCYSSGPMTLAAIPVIGLVAWYVAPIWWIVSAILAVAKGQRVSGGRASLAVLVYPVVFVVVVVGGYMASIFFLIGGMRASGAFMSLQGETTTITSALTSYSTMNSEWPAHPVQLVSDGVAPSTAFVSWSGPTPLDPSQVNLGDTDLQSFELLPTNRRNLKAQALADAQPANLVAQRVGDAVFTYFGIDPANADPGLWIVVLAPQPNLSGAAQPPSALRPSNQVWVGLADGTVINISGMVTESLAEQNALRAQEGLPPLPDPTTLGPGATATIGNGDASEPGDS